MVENPGAWTGLSHRRRGPISRGPEILKTQPRGAVFAAGTRPGAASALAFEEVVVDRSAALGEAAEPLPLDSLLVEEREKALARVPADPLVLEPVVLGLERPERLVFPPEDRRSLVVEPLLGHE